MTIRLALGICVASMAACTVSPEGAAPVAVNSGVRAENWQVDSSRLRSYLEAAAGSGRHGGVMRCAYGLHALYEMEYRNHSARVVHESRRALQPKLLGRKRP